MSLKIRKFNVVNFLYAALIISFVSPSGSVLNIPIKIILCFGLIAALLLFCQDIYLDKRAILFIIPLACVCLWSVLAVYNGYFSTIFQFIKSYFSLIFVVWITYLLVKYKIIECGKILSLISVVSIFLVAIKIILSLSLSFGLMEVDSLVNIYKTVFNTDLTTMYFPIGGFTFYRLMVSNDSIPFVTFSMYLISNRKRIKKALITCVMAVYTFLIYSRVIIIQFVCIVAMALFIAIRKKFVGSAAYFVAFVALALGIGLFIGVGVYGSDNGIIQAIISRFSGSSTEASDDIRLEQLEYLWNGFKNSPLFGYGTGSYVKEYIRSESLMFSYELEYMSFLYQFGILGFVLIIGVTIFNFYKICFSYNLPKYIYFMLLMDFVIWLAKPLLNPNFLSSNSGFILLTIFMFKEKFKNKNKRLNKDNVWANKL